MISLLLLGYLLKLHDVHHFGTVIIIKTPIDRIRAIIRICPLITDTQTNTLDW